MSDRYQADGVQAQWQPGSGDQVLANKLGITSVDDMAEAELVLLQKLYEAVLLKVQPQRALQVADLKRWHRRWLGNVYAWAGEERAVNLSKGGFHFAVAMQVPRLLAEFERKVLAHYTPCNALSDAGLVEAIALCHVEFILIHPFREGNGRLSRLLADVMAVQARGQPLDYSPWDADKPAYFKAIQQGVGGEYAAMKRLTAEALGL